MIRVEGRGIGVKRITPSQEYPSTKISNLALLLANAWGKRSLSLSLLKPVEIERFGTKGILFIRLALRGLFSQVSSVWGLVCGVWGLGNPLHQARASRHFSSGV